MVAAEETALVPIETRALAQFDVTPEAVAERVKEFENLHLVPGDAKSYKQVKGAYMVLVHLRNGVDKRRKELGEEARKWTNALSAAAKKLVDPTAPLENRLKVELDMEDTRVAVIEAEKVRKEKERVDTIRARIESIRTTGIATPDVTADALRDRFLNLFELDIDDSFQEFKIEAQAAKDSSIALLKEAIAKREAWEKEEAERKVEAERLEKIRKEQEAERKRLEEMERKIAEETAKFNAERRAEEQRWRDEADAKAKAEREAKEAEEKKEREAREAKEKAEAEQKKKSYLEQDKEKLLAFAHDLGEVQAPVLNTEASNVILSDASKAIRGVIAMIRKETDKL